MKSAVFRFPQKMPRVPHRLHVRKTFSAPRGCNTKRPARPQETANTQKRQGTGQLTELTRPPSTGRVEPEAFQASSTAASLSNCGRKRSNLRKGLKPQTWQTRLSFNRVFPILIAASSGQLRCKSCSDVPSKQTQGSFLGGSICCLDLSMHSTIIFNLLACHPI